ncbi:antitoxin family protein [Nostocales cyanobacterium LEGE 11386]|nr:antitoxin family protein [Nostocales cyanobacterium LEGE 11386]
MPQTLKAIYRNGAFILQTACNLPEGAEVELLIQSPQVVSPPISDSETKQHFLKALVERMQQNPIPLNAQQFTREMLHERGWH